MAMGMAALAFGKGMNNNGMPTANLFPTLDSSNEEEEQDDNNKKCPGQSSNNKQSNS